MTKSPDEAPTPSLRGLIDKLIDQKLGMMEGPMPAKVTSYDSTKQRISAQPLVQRVYYDEVGNRKTKSRPIVQDVPVYFMGGNGTRITFGLKSGDTVLLIPCGPSIARWVVRGGEVDPGESQGSISDCIALAGLHDFAHVPTTAPDDVVVTHGETRIGSPLATEKIIKGDTYRTAEDTLFGLMAAAFAESSTGLIALGQSGAANAAMAAAFTAFFSAAASYLSLKGKVF